MVKMEMHEKHSRTMTFSLELTTELTIEILIDRGLKKTDCPLSIIDNLQFDKCTLLGCF